MSEEENSKDEEGIETAAADEHTTEPRTDTPGKWEMPEPVFQQTSGYLPQGFVKQVENAGMSFVQEENQTAPSPQPVAPQPPAIPTTPTVPVVAIEPQPDISEQFTIDEFAAEPQVVAKPKSGAFRIALFVFGLVAIFVVIAVFLAAIYFLFLKTPGSSSNF